MRSIMKGTGQHRRLVFEPLERRELLSVGGRPLPPGSVGDNIAHDCSYTWSSAPTYSGCTDSGDVTQLTDGAIYTGGGSLWMQQSTVGWQNASAVNVTIDLGVVQPIQGTTIHMGGGSAEVYWPMQINVSVSNDNVNWYSQANLATSPPAYGDGNALWTYGGTNNLATFGRYVKFEMVNPAGDHFIFADEIQVFRGADLLLGQNIALASAYNTTYTLSPTPNYSVDTNDPSLVKLTDGQYTSGFFWVQTTTVGWQNQAGCLTQITIDLKADKAIEGISFNTAAGGWAAVQWPSAINVLVSTDNVNFYNAGEAISLSVDHGLPKAGDYVTHSYWTDRLTTHGRYVKIVAADNFFVFADEIEVYQGRSEMLGQAYQGSPITNLTTFMANSQKTSSEIRRVVLDAQEIQQKVDAATGLTPAQRAAFTSQLKGYIAQAMYMPQVSSLVLPLNDLHRQVFGVQAALWRAEEGLLNVTAWTTSSPWDLVTPTQTPGTSADINVTMMRNEFRSAAVNISNPTTSDLDVTVRIEGLPGGTNPSYVAVQSAEWADTASGSLAPLALVDVQLSGGGYVIHVPSGMTRQVWLTFNPTTTIPGTYSGTVVVDGGSAGTANVPVQLRLSALTFPTQPTLGLYGWDETNTTTYAVTTANRDSLISELKEHFVDTTWATSSVMPIATNFTEIDAWVDRWQGAQYQYRIFLNVGTTFGGYTQGTSGFNAAVGAWIRTYVEHLRNVKGIDPSRIGFLVTDEPGSIAGFNTTTCWAKAIKGATYGEPNALVWTDAYLNTSSYNTNSAYRTAWTNMANAVDVLCTSHYSSIDAATWQAAYVNTGKTLEIYKASTPPEQLDPSTYYRMQAWECWKSGGTAIGYWAFGDQGRAASWKTTYSPGVSYTPLFLDPTTVTDGKDMDAIREGIEDYQYLRMLQDRIDELPVGDRAAVQAVLDGAVNAVWATSNDIYYYEGKDHTAADVQRIHVLDMLEQLAVSLPGDANRDGTTDVTDLNTVLSYYNQTGTNWSTGDFNADGITDVTDLNTVLSYYNQSLQNFGLTAPADETPEVPSANLMPVDTDVVIVSAADDLVDITVPDPLATTIPVDQTPEEPSVDPMPVVTDVIVVSVAADPADIVVPDPVATTVPVDQTPEEPLVVPMPVVTDVVIVSTAADPADIVVPDPVATTVPVDQTPEEPSVDPMPVVTDVVIVSVAADPAVSDSAPSAEIGDNAAPETLATPKYVAMTVDNDPAIIALAPMADDGSGAGHSWMAAEGQVPASPNVPAPTDLRPIVDKALAWWIIGGGSDSTSPKVGQVQFAIRETPDIWRGEAQPSRVYHDRYMASRDPFVDRALPFDRKFASSRIDQRLRAIDPRVVDRIDLLTVAEHELENFVGFDDLDALANDLMSNMRETSVRQNVYRDHLGSDR